MSNQDQAAIRGQAEEIDEDFVLERDLPWLAQARQQIYEEIKELSPQQTAAYFRQAALLFQQQMEAQQPEPSKD
ncbi:MAG TPA: hypothetical protein VF707_13240 [Ardenticatenaceae bacterium]|jgi:hypothetical protein